MTSQLGAQFGFALPGGGQGISPGDSVFDTTRRGIVTPPGSLRIGQTLYVLIFVENEGTEDTQAWIMPWWLHPTFEFRYPGQSGYTAQDTTLFGPQITPIGQQDSLWMTSPKRLDIIGSPSPYGSSISDMQSDIWAIDVPAGKTVTKAFFYPSHGYGMAVTSQMYNESGPSPSYIRYGVRVTPGALHSVFQDSQG